MRAEWIDLTPYWDALRRVADGRDDQKRTFASSRYWNKKSHFLGLLAEMVYGLTTGQAPDLTLRLMGDQGVDFPGVDVKGARIWRDPWLKVPVGHRPKADTFALVALDLDGRRGYVVGTASRGQVMGAPIRRWGHGPQWSLPGDCLAPL